MTHALVYDGDCRMCTSVAQVVRRWDARGDIEILASQQPGVTERFPWIAARAFGESLQLIGPGKQTWQGAAAIEQLLTILPRGRTIAWIFRIPFIRPIAERVYRWIARNRHRLGCGDHCRAISS